MAIYYGTGTIQTTDTVWYAWTANSITCADTDVWSVWNQGTTSSAITYQVSSQYTTGEAIWRVWTIDSNTAEYVASGQFTVWEEWLTEAITQDQQRATRELIAEGVLPQNTHEKAHEKFLTEWQTAIWEYDSWKAAEADRVAERLLVANLDEEQKAQHQKERTFFVRSKSGRLYRIRSGATHGNVCLVDPATKEDLASFCVQPSGVPKHDANLAQKLYIEHDEQHFLAKANITSYKTSHPEVKRLYDDQRDARRVAA